MLGFQHGAIYSFDTVDVFSSPFRVWEASIWGETIIHTLQIHITFRHTNLAVTAKW